MFPSSIASGRRVVTRQYLPLAAAPSLTAPHTTIPSDDYAPGFFTYANFGGTNTVGNDVILSGNFNLGLDCNGFSTTVNPSPYYRMVNFDGATVLGSSSLADHAMQTIGSFSGVELYGKSATEPLVFKSQTQNGAQIGSTSFGSYFLFQNCVVKGAGASGMTANFGSTSIYYESVTLYQYRTFNTGEEGICYLGHTSNPFSYLNYATVTHCFSYISQREGTQFEHINYLTSHHNTCVLPGQTATGGQNHGLQAHDIGAGSTIAYNIYDGSKYPFNIFTHGLTISYTYFGFTNSGTGYGGFIGRTDNSYFSTSPRLTGEPLIFYRCYFNYTGVGTLTYMTSIEERVANIIFLECVFSPNITNAYLDNRVAGYTNTITGTIGTNGNTSATILSPTYITGYNDQDDYEHQGLLTSPFYLSLRMGYRTMAA